MVPMERLEALFGKKIEQAPRELCESAIEPILERARTSDIAMLVVGDPFGATTHCDMLARAKAIGVPINVVHNASIMNAVGCCGLQLYRYGESISVPFFTRTWRPDSFYDKLAANRKLGLHTLTLLDIKVREPTMASLARGRPTWLPPRYMSIRQAIDQLLTIEDARKEGVCPPETMAVGLSRVGDGTQQVVVGTLAELRCVDFGKPLHSMVVLGKVGTDEAELLDAFCEPAKNAPTLSTAAAKAEDTASARADAAHAGEEYRSDSEIYGDDDEEEAAFDLTAFEAEELKKKQESERKKAAEQEERDAKNAARDAEIAAKGKRAAGGVHKFDPDEVDVHGGDATADDFLDAFGFGDDAGAGGDAGGEEGDINYADELKKYLMGALNSVLSAQPKDPFREMQQVLFQASLSGAGPLTAVAATTAETKAYEAKYGLEVSVDDCLLKMKKRLVVGPKSGFKFLLSDAGDIYTELSKKLKAAGGDLGLGMSAEELAAKDKADAKAKREKEAKAEAERDAADAENAKRAAALEASGKKATGGLHKFDASEVDVHGGDATADDFLDAFGF